MKFTSSTKSFKISACKRAADRIAAAAEAMGLAVRRSSSRASASEYLSIGAGDEDGETIKVRVSDHADRGGHDNGAADLTHWHDHSVAATVAEIAERFGRTAPTGFTATAEAARRAAAEKAAATRHANIMDEKRAMIAAVIAAMAGERAKGTVTAGKVFDRLYPSAPTARRSDVAYFAARHFKQGGAQ